MPKRLDSSKRPKAPRLTQAQTKLIRKYSKNAKEFARKARQVAREEKAKLIKEHRQLSSAKRGSLTKRTGLNTWETVAAKTRARLEVRAILKGKDKGKYKDTKTGKIITRGTLNRKIGAYRYHSQVRHLRLILGGSYAQARKAYKAFLVAGVLAAIEFESAA